MNVVVIDLGVSNIPSVTAALSYLGAPHIVSRDPDALKSATHIVLPGVGAFDAAMRAVDQLGFAGPLRQQALELKRPMLGVCLGMQLLFESSQEGVLPGLAMLPGHIQRLLPSGLSHKVPHVGFSRVYGYADKGFFNELGHEAHFYFTHSFALPDLTGGNIAFCDHTQPFVAAFQIGNVFGAQFHPEKSQSAGLRLISNFLEFAETN
jgi:glutamine amidotransferase